MAIPTRILSTVALAALLAGCQALQGADATRTESGGGLPSAQLVERDIEAPEVFSAEDVAIWDGRPSLGGVWVAALDVRKPERVIIRNPQTGKFIVGALFRKEHADDGLALQLSSDAAVALGVAAGQPTDLSVVALRTREDLDADAAPIAQSDPFAVEGVADADEYLGPGQIEEPVDPADAADFSGTGSGNAGAGAADVATTALDGGAEDGAGVLADLADLPAAATGTAAATGSGTGTTAIDAAGAAAAPLEMLARVDAAVAAANAAEAGLAAAPDAVPGAAASAGPLASIASAAIDAAETPIRGDGDAVPTTQASAPVPAELSDQIAAAIAATEAAEAQARAEGRYVPVAISASAPGVTTSGLGAAGFGPATGEPVSRDFVLVGSYGNEGAAKTAQAKFDGTGMGTEIRRATVGGRPTWRVVVGPVQTVDQQSATLRKARALGFDDAYPVGG